MPIRFTCPGCKKTLNVADKLAGQRAKCPGCQTSITIPALTESAPAAPAPPVKAAAEKKPEAKKPLDDYEFGLAPLDDDPIPKPVPVAKKPAPAPAAPAAKKPTPPAPQATPAAKPKAPAPTKPAPDLDDFGLAPLDDELLPKAPAPKAAPPAKPAAAKPSAAPPAAAPQAKKPAAPAPAVKQPAAQKPAAQKTASVADDMLLAPLGDDLFPAAAPEPKPAAKPAKPGAAPAAEKPAKPAAKPPVAQSFDEDEEQDFNLAPLSDLSHDPLGAAVPLASAAMPAGQANNPYSAPQAVLSGPRSFSPQSRLPVWSTVGEFLNKYAENIGNSAILGIKIVFINFGFILLALGYFYTFIKLAVEMNMNFNIFRIIWFCSVAAGLIAWFVLQCWLIKGLLNYGYCVAYNDERGAESALSSPGSLLQFIITGFINLIILVLFSAIVIVVGFQIHWAMILPALIAIGVFINVLALNFFCFFHRDVNFFSVFGLWWKIVIPHLWKYTLLMIVMNIITAFIELGLAYLGTTVGKPLLRDLAPYLPRDPNIVIGLGILALSGIYFGILGSYYSILQGVCFKRMVQIYEGEYDE